LIPLFTFFEEFAAKPAATTPTTPAPEKPVEKPAEKPKAVEKKSEEKVILMKDSFDLNLNCRRNRGKRILKTLHTLHLKVYRWKLSNLTFRRRN
jgi:hypothetical protein